MYWNTRTRKEHHRRGNREERQKIIEWEMEKKRLEFWGEDPDCVCCDVDASTRWWDGKIKVNFFPSLFLLSTEFCIPSSENVWTLCLFCSPLLYTQFNLLILSLTAKNKSWHWSGMVWEVVGALWGSPRPCSQIIGENSEQKLGIFRRLIFFPLLSTTQYSTNTQQGRFTVNEAAFLSRVPQSLSHSFLSVSGCCVLWAFIRHTESVWIRIEEGAKKFWREQEESWVRLFSSFSAVSISFLLLFWLRICCCSVCDVFCVEWPSLRLSDRSKSVRLKKTRCSLSQKNRQNDPALPTSPFSHSCESPWRRVMMKNGEIWQVTGRICICVKNWNKFYVSLATFPFILILVSPFSVSFVFFFSCFQAQDTKWESFFDFRKHCRGGERTTPILHHVLNTHQKRETQDV